MEQGKTGEFIATCRKEKGYNQKELAQRLNVTVQAVSRWERGVGYPDITMLMPLAKELDTSVLEIMEGEKMKKEITKKTVEHSLEYYLASSMESRRPLGHALNGLKIWLAVFLIVGIFLGFGMEGEIVKVPFYVVRNYYFSMGTCITIFWMEKVHDMTVAYGLIPEREYKYKERKEGQQPKVIMMPWAFDGRRKQLPSMVSLAETDGTEIQFGEMLWGIAKILSVGLTVFFWLNCVNGNYDGFSEHLFWFDSLMIVIGGGLIIYAIYQMVQAKQMEESTRKAWIKIGIGIAVAVVPAIILCVLAGLTV